MKKTFRSLFSGHTVYTK